MAVKGQPITIPNSHLLDHHYLDLKLNCIDTTYDTIYSALWCTLNTNTSPVLSLSLLKDIRSLQDSVAQHCKDNPKRKPKYMIWQSNNEKIFNLGIDLEHVYGLIVAGNEKELNEYIQLCIDAYYINLVRLDISPLITISLIRGKAYGGGLDAALACDIVVAEKNAKCRFPEINYHLLPSIGTVDMLLRQYPIEYVEQLLFEGKNLNLQTLLQMRVLHTTLDEGEGIRFIKNKIKHLHKRHMIYAAMFKSKRDNIVVNYQELENFRKLWVQTALELKPEHIRKLNRIVTAQRKLSANLSGKTK